MAEISYGLNDLIKRGKLPPLTPPAPAPPAAGEPIPQKTERLDSGAGTISLNQDGVESRNAQLRFQVHSLAGLQAAEQKARDIASRYYSGHRRSQIRCTPVGAGWYEIEIDYENAGTLQKGGDISRVGRTSDGFDIVPGGLSFDTTGQTERVFQSWSDSGNPSAYQSSYKNATDPVDPWNTQGAINVNENSVQGADITVPGFSFTETWSFPAQYVLGRTESQRTKKAPYLRRIYDMTGTVNKARFRVFEPGEVLFLGARGDISPGSAMVTITFSFAARANRKEFHVGQIEVAEKRGWDLLWVEYESVADQDRLLKQPRYVFVDRLYEYTDFDVLEIGEVWKTIYLQPEKVAKTGTFIHPTKTEAEDVAPGQ
jgi:hypothetical protein